MKIKQKYESYENVLKMKKSMFIKPKKPNLLFRTLLKRIAVPELREVNFRYDSLGMERLKKNEPCLILMNHSSFIDLKIAALVFQDRPYNTVCTADGFVGKKWLMRQIGCIPTSKFVSDVTLVKNMNYALKKLHSSILMYPEASYSFDGTNTPLPESLGKCVKLLGVPVIMVKTFGAYARDPLYNGLQKRKVKVSATVEYLLSPEEISKKPPVDIQALLTRQFTLDYFKWQEENQIVINEPFRADYLNRVLYKCPACKVEGQMQGKGILLQCHHCGKTYELTETGSLKALKGNTEFPHIPDWYQWERMCVREEIQKGQYEISVPVEIAVLVNLDCLYHVGEGLLIHTNEGFHLSGCQGSLSYKQPANSGSYSLYADYYWYEIGDVICIGTKDISYYCFPTNSGDTVAKVRLATELLYQLNRQR